MSPKPQQKRLAPLARIILAIAGLPCLILGGFLVLALVNGEAATIGAFEVLYVAAGAIAAYLAISGRRLF